jgi:hypothetical protein
MGGRRDFFRLLGQANSLLKKGAATWSTQMTAPV